MISRQTPSHQICRAVWSAHVNAKGASWPRIQFPDGACKAVRAPEPDYVLGIVKCLEDQFTRCIEHARDDNDKVFLRFGASSNGHGSRLFV